MPSVPPLKANCHGNHRRHKTAPASGELHVRHHDLRAQEGRGAEDKAEQIIPCQAVNRVVRTRLPGPEKRRQRSEEDQNQCQAKN